VSAAATLQIIVVGVDTPPDADTDRIVTEISVVIPTHNRWSLLRRTLAGALAQEDVDLEVVVVDDGSSDETPERLSEIADPCLRVLRNEVAGGVSHARNRGIEAVRGEWIAFLDDDDLWAPRKLRAQLDRAAETGATFVYTTAILIDPDLEIVDVQQTFDPAQIKTDILRIQIVPGGCSNMITRAASVRAVGGFDPGFRVAEDWDMWIRLLAREDVRPAALPEPLYGYYQHTDSSVVVNKDAIRADFERIRNKHAAAREAQGVRLDPVAHSRWLAQNFRRAGDRRGAARTYLAAAREGRDLGNLIRAGGALLGESAMTRFSPYKPPEVPRPAWLDLYLPGGPLASIDPARPQDATARR
jgi:glycosyltransferase involved in cell wall biosynthesis